MYGRVGSRYGISQHYVLLTYASETGPYANAVVRFEIAFPEDYPAKPPIVAFLTDVFHPLIAPLTTYTYSTRDQGTSTFSASDEEKLPPGGLTLRHGFPEWFAESTPTETLVDRETVPVEETANGDELEEQTSWANTDRPTTTSPNSAPRSPHIVEMLQYMHVIFDTAALIDSVSLEVAANPGAWHAWQSHRAKHSPTKTNGLMGTPEEPGKDISRERSLSPRQQPGGARRPGQWNWTGVWEDRTKKAIQASIAETTLFGGDESRVVRQVHCAFTFCCLADICAQINFMKLNDDVYASLPPIVAARVEPVL